MKVGIDLGTTYSLIAHLDANGKPLLIPDNNAPEFFSTPSAVYINDRSAVVGSLVDTMLEQKPDLPVIRFFKRSFGTDKPLFIDRNSNPWYPETVGALVLKKLKFDAESYTGEQVESAVITVPAHFNDHQRKSVLNAAHLADIPVLGLVEEPVAAALHYGIVNNSIDNVLVVYDLGGGTFDATVLCLNETGVYVLAKDGITELGGKEFDEAISSMILDQYKKATGMDLELSAAVALQLRRVSEEIKIELSFPSKTFVKKTILLGSSAFEVLIYRRDFELAIRRMIEQTIEVTLHCIDSAGFRETDINALMFVGGSSMMPVIKERMSKIISSPKQKIFLHEPMKAVALGAALHAAQLSGEAGQYNIPPEFRGVTGYNIGIQTINLQTKSVEIDCLIKKNMPLPAQNKRTYFTTNVNQTRIVLQVVQYASLSEPMIEVGELTIGPIQNPSVNYPVEITVENTIDGIIKVNAFDPNTGVEIQQKFTHSSQTLGFNFLSQKQLIANTQISNFAL